MINSRNIDDLRPDVAAACRRVIEIARREGLPVLITSTGRDREYQEKLYAKGRSKPGRIVTNSRIPTFHNIEPDGALAFDFCKNIKGQEYSDSKFFDRVGEIGESLGLEWAGRWTKFIEKAHLQWSGYSKEYTSSDIRAGRRPPKLILKGKVKEEDKKMVNTWAKKHLDGLVAKGIIETPEAWEDFDSPVNKALVLALMDKLADRAVVELKSNKK